MQSQEVYFLDPRRTGVRYADMDIVLADPFPKLAATPPGERDHPNAQRLRCSHALIDGDAVPL